MREIKFRAWDEVTKKLFTWEEVCEMGFEWVLNNPSMTVLQFTGLHDKNGKEIYEGDVVTGVVAFPQLTTWDNDENCNVKMGGVVEYNHSDFILRCEHTQNLCDPDRDGMVNWFDFIGDVGEIFHDMTVIGDIYQNPELLKV